MHPEPPDDVLILAERFQLGIPLLGLDGTTIPIRDEGGRPYTPVEAALLLLKSSLHALEPEAARQYLDTIIDRALLVEDEGLRAGLHGIALDRRIAGVIVSAAVRADLVGRHGEVSPSDLNRATLDWYQVHQARRAALLSDVTWAGRTA